MLPGSLKPGIKDTVIAHAILPVYVICGLGTGIYRAFVSHPGCLALLDPYYAR